MSIRAALRRALILSTFLLAAAALPDRASAWQEVVHAMASRQAASPLDRAAALTVEAVPLDEALLALQEKSGVSIVYSPSLLPSRRVTCSCAKAAVDEALRVLLDGTGMRFAVLGGHVVIEPNRPVRRPPVEPTFRLAGTASPFPPARVTSATNAQHPLLPAGLILRQLEGTIAGRVVDAVTQQPIGMARVHIPELELGTLSNADGFYSLPNVPAGTHTVVAEVIGYRAEGEDVTVVAGGTVLLDFELTQTAVALDELVVVGYGQQRRATVSGAVSTVSSDQLNTATATTLASGLAGAVQGISVRMTTTAAFGIERSGPGGSLANQIQGDPVDGRPGSTSTLQIRNMGNPLFVIDGIPSNAQAFNHLNAADIEDISILKDASAAVYGFRAANGVVLVTTKRGSREQAPRISISSSYGWQNLTRYHYMRMYNAYDYLWNVADSNSNLGLSNNLTDAERAAGRGTLENWRQGGPGFQSTDHYRMAVVPNAPQYNLNTSVSGGTQNTRYYLSLGHVQQDYSMRDFTWGRTNLAANLTVDLSSRIRIGTELRAQNGVTDGVAILGDIDPIRHLLFTVNSSWPHEQPLIGPNNEFIAFNVRRLDRTVGMLGQEQSGWTQDVRRLGTGNFWAEYTFPFGTTLRATYSATASLRNYDMAAKSWDAYCHDAVNDAYEACWNSGDRTRQNLNERSDSNFGNVTLSHSQSFGSHSLFGLAFMELDGSETQQFTLIGQSPTNYTHILEQARVTGIENRWAISRRASTGGRIDYDYNEKYLATVLARYDGSYLYAPGQRWGFFPGVSLGWRITQEPFLRNRVGFLQELKLRGSWGQTGREQGIDPWGFLAGATYGAGNGSVFGGDLVTGARPRGLPVTNLTWVTSTMRNIGVDAVMFDGRLSIEADLFERALSGLPSGRDELVLPNEVGYSLPNENLNKDVMRGFEFGLTWNDRVGQVRYSITPNLTIARSRPEFVHGQRYGSSWHQYRFGTGNNTAVGRWYGVSFGYRVIGQFQSIEEIESHPVLQDGQDNRNLLPGDLIFEDVNGDGVINEMDMVPIGFGTEITPILSYGARTSVSYAGVTLTADLSGGAIFSHLRDWEMRFQGWGGHNGPAYGMDRWRREDPYDQQSAWIPGRYPPIRVNRTGSIFPSFNTNDFWRTNVRFLRVRNVELSYNLPDRFAEPVGLSGVRVFANMSNPFSIDNTRHYMMDPEVVQPNGQVYPTIRLLSVGFSATIGGVGGPVLAGSN